MTPLAKATEVLFIAAWCVGVAAHIYATRYWLPMWAAGFKEGDKRKGYMRKAVVGYGVFALAILVGFVAGAVGQYWGGGWR